MGRSLLITVALAIGLAGCGPADNIIQQTPQPAPSPPLDQAARNQIGVTTLYDANYVRLAYPNGDVPIDRGACTDVVIRSLRTALDLDLQKLVHEDMAEAFAEYPRLWGLKEPDSHIDHRRVPNLQAFFRRKGWSLRATREPNDYRPGDLVTCVLPGNRPHIMVVSDRLGRDGIPLVIHNIGNGVREEDRLFEFPITGHYCVEQPASR